MLEDILNESLDQIFSLSIEFIALDLKFLRTILTIKIFIPKSTITFTKLL